MSATPQTVRGRAAAILDVAPEATPEMVHAAFLRRLASEGFAPPEECIIAANAIAITALPLSLDGLEEQGAFQRAAVETFASGYWSLEPAQRRGRWRELTEQTNDAQAKSRLAEMEGGLDRTVAPHFNAMVNEIAEAIRELYVLGPRERVVRRVDWLAERSTRIDVFRDAARRFRTEDPALAQLEPKLLSELARAAAFAPVPAIDSAIADAERSERAMKAAAQVQEQIVKTRVRAQQVREESGGGWMNSKLGCLVLPVAIAIVRVIIGLATHTDRTQNYTPPSGGYSSPQPRLTPQDGSGSKGFQVKWKPEQVERFKEYEQRQKAAGNVERTAPPLYDFWVRAGRPEAAR